MNCAHDNETEQIMLNSAARGPDPENQIKPDVGICVIWSEIHTAAWNDLIVKQCGESMKDTLGGSKCIYLFIYFEGHIMCPETQEIKIIIHIDPFISPLMINTRYFAGCLNGHRLQTSTFKSCFLKMHIIIHND